MMWLIYIYGLLDALNSLLFGVALILVGAAAGVLLFGTLGKPYDEDYDYSYRDEKEMAVREVNKEKNEVIRKKFRKFGYTMLGLSCVLFIMFTAIPSSNTFAAMVLLPRIAENKDVQQLPGDAAKLLNVGLQKWVKDLGEKAK